MMGKQKLDITSCEFESLAREILSSGRGFSFEARGQSMSPFVRDKDVLTIMPIQSATLRIGNIILYHKRNGALAAHRILGISGHREDFVVFTRGDSSGGDLERVDRRHVLGLATRVTRERRVRRLNTHRQRALGIVWAGIQSFRCFLRRIRNRLKETRACLSS